MTEHPDTLAPDARDTEPPASGDAEAERVMSALLPPSTPREALVTTSDSLLMEVIREVSAAAAEFRRTREERSHVDERTARLQQETLDAVLSADKTSQQNYETLQLAIAGHNRRLADGDARFVAIEKSISEMQALRGRLQSLNSAFTEMLFRLDALEKPETPNRRELSNKTILVVEDDPLLAATITRMLRGRGAKALVALSWAEARPLAAQNPDCVLLDLLLAADDGFEVANWLTAEGHVPKSRIVLMTGQIGTTNQSGFALIEKPFSSADLVDVIKECLQR